MTVFIKCYISGDKSPLVTNGTPPEVAIEDAWLTIYSEYCQLVGGVQISALIKRTSAIQALASKIDRLDTLLMIAQNMVHEGVCEDLRMEGYKIDPDATDEVYLSQVSAAISRLKAEKLRLDHLVKEKPKAKVKEEQPSEREFSENLMHISKHVKFQVRKETITVEDYGLYMQDLRRYIESLPTIPNAKNRAK